MLTWNSRCCTLVPRRDAKVALVEWDDEMHCLRNGSMHSFEGDASLREGCPCGTGMNLNSSSSSSNSSYLSVPPIVAADPNGRCAAALVYGRHLALLPAIQADVLEMLLQVCWVAAVPMSGSVMRCGRT
jgi:cleavage and polyadenylation specificity factor subunit 1